MPTHIPTSTPLPPYIVGHLASKIPPLYYTEQIAPANRTIYLHLSLGALHWFVAEFDRVETFFGFSVDCSACPKGTWEYFSLSRLAKIQRGSDVVSIDAGWQICPASSVELIQQASGL